MTRPTTSARLGLHALGAREVPAAAFLINGTLNVVGNGTAETITVRQTASAITVDGVSGSFSPLSVSEIRVDALGGNDVVSLNKVGAVVTKRAVVFAGAGNDYLYGNGGADKIVGDLGNDLLRGGAGHDSLAGGDGADQLYGDAGNDRLGGGRQHDNYYAGAGDRVYDDTVAGILVGGAAVGTGYSLHHGWSDLGWYDEYLGDAAIRRLARAAERDGTISRAEMIEVLESAKDGGSVDATEWGDLKEVAAADAVGMSAAVRHLSNKVVSSGGANLWHTGGAGTRQAALPFMIGTTAARLQQIVDKWFRGADLPAAKNVDKTVTFSYQAAAGSLFVNGPSAEDIDQGGLGDCYLMSALEAVAHRDPQRIKDMFTDNGDGTWTVRFFRDGEVRYVTVDRRLPVNADGWPVYAGTGTEVVGGQATRRAVSDAGNELWVALAEKAYAQLNESGWTGQDGTNSYKGVNGVAGSDGINGGNTGRAMEHVAGVWASYHGMYWTSFADVREAFDAGRAITFGTVDVPENADVAGDHVYIMVSYNAATQKVVLRNPWGTDGSKPVLLTLSIDQLDANFFGWHGVAV